jgi:hypothetical protein
MHGSLRPSGLVGAPPRPDVQKATAPVNKRLYSCPEIAFDEIRHIMYYRTVKWGESLWAFRRSTVRSFSALTCYQTSGCFLPFSDGYGVLWLKSRARGEDG